MSLELRPWRGLEALRAEADRCAQLFRDAQLDPLCNEPGWLAHHARAFVPAGDLFGWTATDGETPVAYLPFRREPSRGAFALRRALFSADGTFDSDYLDLAVLPGREREVVGALLDALARERGVDAVVLAGVPDSSPVLAALRDELERRGLPARVRPGDCMAAQLPSSYAEYIGGLKSRMRSKVRQAVRRAEEAGASLHRCEDDLERHLAGLFELHAQRWEDAGEAGSFADERRRAFYRELAAAYAERSELRFARLDLDGRPVAYQFGVRRGDTYYQLQEGYLPEVEGFRPATALRALSIEKLIEEGVRSYDFMAGGSRHKRDWGGEERGATTIAFALPGLRARLASGLRAWLDRRAARAASS